MILIAALAIWLGVLLGLSADLDWGLILGQVVDWANWSGERAGQLLAQLVSFFTPLAVLMTLTVLAMRFRGPRTVWPRLIRRPGTMACLAPLLAWLFGGLLAWALLLTRRGGELRMPNSPDLGVEVFSYAASILGGFAVAIAWATLALIRRWRVERSWLDRLGRVVGGIWITLAILAAIALFWQTIGRVE